MCVSWPPLRCRWNSWFRPGSSAQTLFTGWMIRIVAPPLREHLEDLSELTEELIARLNRQLGLSVEGVTEEVIHMFQDYSWPGNIRELQTCWKRP